MKQQKRPELPAVPDGAEAQIAHRLRSFYLSVQEEPIPQSFLDLLERLDVAEQHDKLHLGGGDQ